MPGVDMPQMGSPLPQPPMGGQGGDGAPSGTPSGDAVKPSGEMELAKANVLMALAHLERQLPLLGSDSEEGKALLSAISTLSKKFSGKKSADLAPSELMSLMGSQPDAVKQAMMKEMGGAGGPQMGGPGPGASPLQLG